MKALLPLFLILSFSTFADTICTTPNGEMRITKYGDSIWFERPLGNGETQQFSMPLIEGEKNTYGNYSTKLEVTDNEIKRFNDGEFVEALPLSCNDYTLKKIDARRSQFPRKLRNIDGTNGDSCGWGKCENYYFEVNNNFNMDFQGKDLSNYIGDMGDWYSFYPNKNQQQLINKYVEANHQSLLAKIRHYSKSGITFEGYVFARDWYYGSGRVGIVLKKGNIVMLIPISFDFYTFGDSSLDNTY